MYEMLEDHYGTGNLHPFRLLFDASGANMTMTSQEGFDVMHHVVQAIQKTERVVVAESAEDLSQKALLSRRHPGVMADLIDYAPRQMTRVPRGNTHVRRDVQTNIFKSYIVHQPKRNNATS